MGTAMSPIFLPITTVQHDFEAVVTDVREGTVPTEDFWISCYHQNEPSVHGKVRAELDERDRHLVLLEGREGVQIEQGDPVRIGSNLRPVADPQGETFSQSTRISFLARSWVSRKPKWSFRTERIRPQKEI
jgi:hypothetical protein